MSGTSLGAKAWRGLYAGRPKRGPDHEFASDADIGNEVSHRSLGFGETERVVFYRKAIDSD